MPKKVNPRTIPRTQADVDRAKKDGILEGVSNACVIFLTVLVDKFDGADHVAAVWNEINKLSEEIKEGRVSFSDLRTVLREEYGRGSRGKVEAARFKAEGVKPGVPDLFLPVARGPYHGLFIEMKRMKGGRVSDAQKEWIKALTAQGYLATVCYGWQDAAATIEDYLEERGV